MCHSYQTQIHHHNQTREEKHAHDMPSQEGRKAVRGFAEEDGAWKGIHPLEQRPQRCQRKVTISRLYRDAAAFSTLSGKGNTTYGF